MEIIEILAIIFAVLFVAMGLAFIGAKNKHEQASAERDKYRKDYSRMLEELNGTYQDKNKMEIALAKTEREYQELDAVWLQQMERIRRQQSQIDALTELWRHSAARAFDLDTDNYYMRDNLDVLAADISQYREQERAYRDQQRVSDGNVQRLEAERDEAVQGIEHARNASMEFLLERDEAVQEGNDLEELANKHYAALRTQRRHNDTLNAVQARLMRERDEAVADWVQELGLREGWEQTAGELEWETRRLQTALEVQQNAVTRLDAQLVRARANDTRRDPKTGQFVKGKGK